MDVRAANYKDAPSIKTLMEMLGYRARISLLVDQIEMLFGVNCDELFVYERQKEIVGFAAVHYFPQLGFEGSQAFISYLVTDEASKNDAVAKALENYLLQQAYQKGCDQMQVNCVDWRTPDCQFFIQQGYQLFSNLYTKKLVYM